MIPATASPLPLYICGFAEAALFATTPHTMAPMPKAMPMPQQQQARIETSPAANEAIASGCVRGPCGGGAPKGAAGPYPGGG
jgi:hypothetical protein